MAKNVFVGDSNGRAQKVTKMYVGGSDGKAHKVKAAYVGDSNGKARKFWPTNVIPDTNYQQIEYLGGASSAIYGVKFDRIPSPKIYENPRIVIKFKITSDRHGGSLFSCDQVEDELGNYHGWKFEVYAGDNGFYFTYGNYSTSSGHYTFEKDTLSTGDGMHYNKMYTIDYNNISNSTSRFYLYCEEGYYSVSSHQLIGSVGKVSTTTNSSTSDKNFIRLSAHIDGYSDTRNSYTSGIQFYSCKIYNSSNSLVRNLYPCRRISDNAYGFYDIVNRIFLLGTNDIYLTAYDAGPDCAMEL